MSNLLVKICGIRDPATANATAAAGADFIGIIFPQHSRRYTNELQAKEIVQTIKPLNVQPVAVFVNQTAAEMQTICEATGIRIVQLHGEKSRLQHHLLSANYQRIYVCAVNEAGIIDDKLNEGLTYCLPERDFVMFDGVAAGSGQPFNWEQFKADKFFKTHMFRWFLAGGLTVNNVAMAVNSLHPNGVDVSSGVENELGEKDIARINHFIATAKSVV